MKKILALMILALGLLSPNTSVAGDMPLPACLPCGHN
jgi:hypothetical protein